MPLQRFQNWPRRLHILIQSSQAITFQWGLHDCGLFAARWIREATGLDLGAPYRGTYSTEAGADAVFLAGYSDLGSFAAAIAAANSMPEVPPTFARRGDVVWVDNSTPLNPSPYGALGVVGLDPRFAHCMGAQGTVRVHMSRWKRAWQVG
jgi:hypothetical protein